MDLEMLLVKDEMTRISETKDGLRIVHVKAPDDFDRFFLTEECDLKAVYVKGQMEKSLDLQTGWTEHGLRRKKPTAIANKQVCLSSLKDSIQLTINTEIQSPHHRLPERLQPSACILAKNPKIERPERHPKSKASQPPTGTISDSSA
jgi:hypothetical protein